jgi:hypothetical protein
VQHLAAWAPLGPTSIFTQKNSSPARRGKSGANQTDQRRNILIIPPNRQSQTDQLRITLITPLTSGQSRSNEVNQSDQGKG